MKVTPKGSNFKTPRVARHTKSLPPGRNRQTHKKSSRRLQPIGPWEGIYQRKGYRLRRDDGQVIRFRINPPTHQAKSTLFDGQTGDWLGNVYGHCKDNVSWAEFDDRTFRYRIDRLKGDTYRITTLYRKGKRGGQK